jgi:hypothetical protein
MASEYTDVMENSLPPEVVQAIRHGGGGIQLYDTFQELQNPTVHATTNNPLELFLQTLLPWNPVPNAPALNAEGNNWFNNLVDFLGNYLPDDEAENQEEEQH